MSLIRISTEGKVKLVLSLSLVIYSIIVSNWTGTNIAIAMLMSFCGDIYMMKNGDCFFNKEKKDLAMGVFCFMIAHICYASFMNTSLSKVIIWLMTIVVILYATTIAFCVIKTEWIIAFYVPVLLLSVLNTFAFNTVAFVGGVLFLISDVLIGVFYVLKNGRLLRHVLVWGTYIPAQILLLTSLTVLK